MIIHFLGKVWECWLTVLQIVLEAGNGSELLGKLQNTPADVLLLDLQMPEMGGFDTAKCIKERYPEMKILILTLRAKPILLTG